MIKKIITLFDSIDLEAQKERQKFGSISAFRFRVWVIMLSSALSLLVIHYAKYNSSFHKSIAFIEKIFGLKYHAIEHMMQMSKFYELYSHIWWAFWHYLFFLIIPVLIIKFVFKESISSYGWQKGDLHKHKSIYLGAMAFFIVFLSWFSFNNSSFAHYYPFYHLAYRSWFDLIAWEVLYLLQFVALEFFFRGFIVNGLRVAFGSMAIAIMVVPYMMLHLPKLWPEATGAIVFGIFLGVLAIRSRSIWGGVAIHASVALTLDISALLQTHGLPKVLFP